MLDLFWLAFIVACALTGVILTLLWIRARRASDEDADLRALEEAARRTRERRGVPQAASRGDRPPPPTPDLVSIQEEWRASDEERDEPVLLDGLGQQDRGTPTAPSGPRQGWQGVLHVTRTDPGARYGAPSPAEEEAEDEATVVSAAALDRSELDEDDD